MPIELSVDDPLLTRIRNVFSEHADLPVLEGNDTVLTYRELDARSAEVAAVLADAGVVAGQIVPLLMRRSPALVVTQVAVLRLGATYAPIDLASPAARQQTMLQVLDPGVVVADGSVPAPALPAGVRLVHLQDLDRPARSSGSGPWHPRPSGTPAYIMFTSGSTGAPKAVMVPGCGIVRLVCDADFAEFRREARWAFLSSPAFDASTLEVWGALLNGGCCVVQEEVLPSLDDLADFLVDRRIDSAWLTSSLFNAMVEDRCAALGDLRQLLTGGERVSPRHARNLLTTFPRVRLINGYGPTENTTFTLCHAITLADTENPSGIPIGRPVRGTVVRVGDAIEEPVEGELLAGGLGVALGYLNDAELTARKFVELDDQRWYRTGDLVRRRPDGVFEFLGRADRQVKIQGHRIELEEVELTMAACPGVGDVAVLVRGDSAETQQLAACYSGLDGPPPSIDVVAAHLAQRLAPTALPRLLVPLSRFPLSLNGKVDRGALESLLDRAGDDPKTDIAWRSETERQLAAIWQQVLPTASIHRTAHFMRMGGTSLLALRVSAQVRRQLGRDLTPIDVLRVPVLADQARHVDEAPFCSGGTAVDALGDDELPLTRAQQTIVAANQLDESRCAYLVHTALRLEGFGDASSIRHAFEVLASRHPMLRVLAEHDGQRSRARVMDALVHEWWNCHERLVEVPRDMHWPAGVLNIVNRPMDTATDGVMRVDFWPSEDGAGLLVWTVHHVAVDEASIERCLTEIDHLMRGERLSPVYGSPYGFSTLERARTDHQAARQWSELLVNVLGNQPPVVQRPPGLGRETVLPVPAKLDERLKALTTRLGITAFSPLITAYGLALQDVFGERHRFVSTPFSRRAEPELAEPVGYFLDLRFVEAGAKDQETPADALARVYQALLDLQRPTFLSQDAVVNAVALEDPTVLPHINAFGFTWRLNPVRTVAFGEIEARLLRVPQRGARFGICLHASSIDGALHCSIEGMESAFSDGKMEILGDAFLRRLGELCEISALPAHLIVESPATKVNAITIDPNIESGLRSAWTRWVMPRIATVTGESNFLQSGGTSLAAMRMASQLQRQEGLRIDVGAFLANPTFGNLCALAEAPDRGGLSGCVWLGSRHAPRVVVLLPGIGGHALGLFSLAESLQEALGDDAAVAIVDLEAMLRNAPPEQPLWFVMERSLQLFREIGSRRVIGIVGFSLGSLLAIQLARSLPSNAVRVCLIDGYAPRALRPSMLLRVECRTGRLLRRLGPGQEIVPEDTGVPTEHVERGDVDARLEPLWQVLQCELAAKPPIAPNAEVHLIQALKSAQEFGLLWRRRSNGFNPRHYASWHAHGLNARHLELPRALAARTAMLVAECLD